MRTSVQAPDVELATNTASTNSHSATVTPTPVPSQRCHNSHTLSFGGRDGIRSRANRYRYTAGSMSEKAASLSNYHMKRPTPARSLYRNTHIVNAFMAAYHRPSSATPRPGTSLT